MTQLIESGYLGSISVEQSAGVAGVGIQSRLNTVDSNGEPVITPWCEEVWANELRSPDGNHRFLKSGVANGRGVAPSVNCFDTILSNNFTMLTLSRCRSGANYGAVASKIYGGDYPYNGWVFTSAPFNTTSGLYVRTDQNSAAFNQPRYISPKYYDKNWHWASLSLSVSGGTSTGRGSIDGKFVSFSPVTTGAAASFYNTNNFLITANALNDVACVILFNRVLSDTEITSIMEGKTLPNTVAGLVGYYKMNEGYGTVCTDHSGLGNHLTYTSPTWEFIAPPFTNVVSNGTFANSSYWALTLTKPSISGGKLVFAGATITKAATQQGRTFGFTSGDSFRVIADISDIDEVTPVVNAKISIGSDSYYASVPITANGHIDTVVTIPGSGTKTWNGLVNIYCDGTSTFSITNVQVIPLKQSRGQSGHPYVNRPQLDTTKWYNRRPPASVLAVLQGSIGKVGVGGSIEAPANAAYDHMTDLTFCVWHKQVGTYEPLYGDILIDMYGGSLEILLITIAKSGAEVIFSYGVSDICVFTLENPIPNDTWVFVTIKMVSGVPTLYLNTVEIESGAAFTPGDAGNGNALLIREGGYCNSHVRSLRLFNRAISDAEIEELFMTDAITNRTGLVAEFMCNELATVDAIPVLKDTSPTQNHSSAIGTVPLFLDSPYAANRPKRRGKQLRLSGAGGISGMRIDFPDALKTAIAAAPILTFSVWVKARGANALAVATGAEIFAEMLVLSDGAGIQAEGVTAGDFTEYPLKTLKGLNQLGVWCLYSIEVNTITNMEYAYKNGVLVSVVNDSGQFSTPGTFAADRLYGETPFATIDSVRLYNRSLTAAEHRALFFDQAPRDGLLCEYLFDADTSSCLDSSGNNHHGTWNGITAANYVKEY